MTSPVDPRRRIRAVLFDLDGTLYQQTPMRMLMAVELMTIVFRRPLRAGQTWRTLAAYRKTQERLRCQSMTGVARMQLHVAAERAGLTAEQVEAIVNEWMFERPLKYLRWCRASGLFDLLAFLDRRGGLNLGVLSDYPAETKLQALGLAGRFSVVLSSSDPDVGAFKPNPRGFLLASERWHVDPSEVLVVGDRVEVDARGAAAAGMPCVIIGGPDRPALNPAFTNSGFRVLSSLERLRCVLDDGC